MLKVVTLQKIQKPPVAKTTFKELLTTNAVMYDVIMLANDDYYQ